MLPYIMYTVIIVIEVYTMDDMPLLWNCWHGTGDIRSVYTIMALHFVRCLDFYKRNSSNVLNQFVATHFWIIE